MRPYLPLLSCFMVCIAQSVHSMHLHVKPRSILLKPLIWGKLFKGSIGTTVLLGTAAGVAGLEVMITDATTKSELAATRKYGAQSQSQGNSRLGGSFIFGN
ncbi:hypothetical protein V8E36_002297 [Tilletia maclaganii]